MEILFSFKGAYAHTAVKVIPSLNKGSVGFYCLFELKKIVFVPDALSSSSRAKLPPENACSTQIQISFFLLFKELVDFKSFFKIIFGLLINSSVLFC